MCYFALYNNGMDELLSCKETEFFMQLLTYYIWLAQIFC